MHPSEVRLIVVKSFILKWLIGLEFIIALTKIFPHTFQAGVFGTPVSFSVAFATSQYH